MVDYDAEGARSSLGDDPLGTGKNWACPKDDASTSLFVGEMDAYTCPVCYAELFIKHEHETSCEHRFCKKCFKKLCIANASLLGVPCPLCRKLQPEAGGDCPHCSAAACRATKAGCPTVALLEESARIGHRVASVRRGGELNFSLHTMLPGGNVNDPKHIHAKGRKMHGTHRQAVQQWLCSRRAQGPVTGWRR